MNEVVAIFTPAKAARIAGIRPQQLAAWSRHGVITPREAVETGRLRARHLYSFRDVVVLRTLRTLRERHGVAPKDLRKAADFLRQHYEEPWNTLDFSVMHGELVFKEPRTGLAMSATRHWQQVPEWRELEPLLVEAHNHVRRQTRRQDAQIGKVEAVPSVMGNAPCLAGTRIPTSAIWSFHRAGKSTEEILGEYPSLHPEDIAAAIAYESSHQHGQGPHRERRTRTA